MIVLALVLAVQTALAPVRVGGTMPPPTKTRDVRPVYPADAQGSGVQGVVIIEATIDATGKVSDAKVLRSIPMLDQAAVDAVKQWEYTPTLLNGTPVPVIMTVTVNFTMQGGNASSPPGFTPPLSNLQPAKPGMVRLTVSPAPGGAAIVWDITAERAAALPRWNPQSAPSVSMEDAARIAEDSLKARLPDVQRLEVQSINSSRVRRSNPEIDFWYYQVGVYTYRMPPRSGDQMARVVVLPDGTVVEPRVDPNPPPQGGFVPTPPASPQPAVPPGVYTPDAAHGITYPRALNTVNPAYTDEARKKRISGTVTVSCVVRPDGTVSDARVLKSLDPGGLDLEALKAANQYRFVPGTKDGQPVAVFVTIEMMFTLR